MRKDFESREPAPVLGSQDAIYRNDRRYILIMTISIFLNTFQSQNAAIARHGGSPAERLSASYLSHALPV